MKKFRNFLKGLALTMSQVLGSDCAILTDVSADTMQNGVTIVHVDLLCANKMKPSKETLAQESAILQGILLDDLQRGLIPLVAHPTYTDGTPTLSLVGVY